VAYGPGVRSGRCLPVVLLVGLSAGCGSPRGGDATDTFTSDADVVTADAVTADAATDALLSAFDAASTPGCAVGVLRDGAVRFEDGYGAADLEAVAPITPATVFDVASVSKQITAGVVMSLVVDGELGLDDAVDDWLPELDLEPTITVGGLVHHTSGLPDYVELLDADDTEVTTAADAIAVLQGIEGDEPGTRFEYSNTNYFLLGQLVEAVTGGSLAEAAEERIFRPLGMDATRIRDDQGTLDPAQAVGYAEAEDGSWVPVLSAWRQTGDGAVHTTVDDLLRWARIFLDPPRATGVGSSEWLRLMLTPGPYPDEDGVGYGGGIGLDEIDGELVLLHGGSWLGYASYLEVRPSEQLAVAVACNGDDIDAEDLGAAVADVWGG
jgi:CubicO group peptidase (beta-lactamase class C family)